MGFLDTQLYGWLTLMMFLVLLLVVALIVLWYHRNASSKDGKAYKKASAVVAGLVILVLLAGFLIPVTVVPPTHTSTMAVTIAETATASCYDFADYSTDGACDPSAVTGDIVVNDADKIVNVGVLVDWSANAMYAAGSTTAFDSFGITFTVRRTDGGWTENGAIQKMAVSASISGITAWKIKGNVTPQNDINLLAQNSAGVFAIAWTDNGGLTQVGASDAGGLLLLNPSGDSGTIKLTVYFNEVATPRSFAFGTYTRDATITISMQNGPTLTIPVHLSFQAQA